MKKISTLLAVTAALAFPGVAMGQGSGGDAYSEDIPGGGGNQPSNQNDSGSPSSSGTGSALPGGTQADLAAKGEDGAAAANLAQSSGPDSNGNGGQSSSAGEGSGSGSPSGEANSAPVDSGSGGSGIGEVVADLAGGSEDGMGLLLPIILGSVLVAAVAFVLVRRSGGSTGSA